MLKKIFWTIIIVLLAIGAQITSGYSWANIIDFFNGEFWTDINNIIIFSLWLVFVLIPSWYAWKGTKIIPIIMFFPIRVLMILIGIIWLPLLLAFFALWGIWIKS